MICLGSNSVAGSLNTQRSDCPFDQIAMQCGATRTWHALASNDAAGWLADWLLGTLYGRRYDQ